MAQPGVGTSESAGAGGTPGGGRNDTTQVHVGGLVHRNGLSQATGTARVAGAAAMAAVTGAIRGRIHGSSQVPPPDRYPAGGEPRPGGSSQGAVEVYAEPGPTGDDQEQYGGAAARPARTEMPARSEMPARTEMPARPELIEQRRPAEIEAPAADVPPAQQLDGTLLLHQGRWTAQRVLAELPDTPAATIEVLDGSLVVSPRRGIRHQTAVLEFGIALKRAARVAGYGMHPQVKVVVGDEMVTPDLTVSTRLGEDTSCVGADEVILVAEVILADPGQARRIDRAPIFAAGKIGHYLRLDFRGHDPVISLHELLDGEYQPVAVASVGARFTTSRPFDFAIDPVELRGRQVQPRTR